MSWANCTRLEPPLPPTMATAEYRLMSWVRAASASVSSVRAPMPRVGKFTTRINDVSSCGLAIRRR